MEIFYIQMETDILEIGSKIRKMDKGNYYLKTEAYIKDRGKMINAMVLELQYSMMDINMKEIGLMTNGKESGNLLILKMDLNIMENGITINNKVMEQ